MHSKDNSCNVRGTSSCVELIMLSMGRNVYQNTVILTLDTIQLPALYFKMLMLLKENTWGRLLFKQQTFISHGHRSWKYFTCWDLLSASRCHFFFFRIFQRDKLLCPYMAQSREVLNCSFALSQEKINFICWKKTLWLNYFHGCSLYCC